MKINLGKFENKEKQYMYHYYDLITVYMSANQCIQRKLP